MFEEIVFKEVFKTLIEKYRSRGHDQQPSNLFKSKTIIKTYNVEPGA